ncbi:LysR family transcriptional regulator [Halomonas aquamarina]|uniref:LysR family transcriptional regulator n=1 Tax=Vreelandella aquamarina TaxID=77097 RepID=A0ACC5VSA3_9GAMM|nr:LysR substrate-binding domain-containing protein [Halomonas aquamarina]MBZ5487158.1 LysR family transcriptional regulator [Halomonas aquamarina]
MSTLKNLDFFITLCRAGNMSNAARELDISPAAVSKRLSNLEKSTNIQLFNRNTRTMKLTAEGQIYLTYAEQALAYIHEMEEQIAQRGGEVKGLLKINAPLGFGRKYMADAIAAFLDSHPNVEAKLHLSDHPLNLAENAYDIGIRFGELPDSSLHSRMIATHRRIVCASPEYIARYGKPLTPDALAQHNCITLQQNNDAWSVWKFYRGTRSYSVRVAGTLSANDGESVTRWALEGRGIVIRAEWDLKDHLAAGRLVPLLTGYSTPNADIHAVYQHYNVMPARIRLFIEHLRDFMTRTFGAR